MTRITLASAILGTFLYLATSSTGQALVGPFKKKSVGVGPNECSSAREFITAHEYLKKHRESLGIEDQQIRHLAEQIAEGCTGAASRFIQTVELLRTVDLDGQTSFRAGLLMAAQPPPSAETFLKVFKTAYLQSELDLPLNKSLELAQALSVNFRGDAHRAGRDFDRLIRFCKRRDLALPLPKCGEYMVNLIQRTADFPLGVSSQFQSVFEILRTERQLQMPVGQAMELAGEIAATSPQASTNFISAYKYALSSGGMNLNPGEALNFARQISSLSHRENYDHPHQPVPQSSVLKSKTQ
jgi:hypothetical protein